METFPLLKYLVCPFPPDGTPLSWWKDRAGEKRTYWAGLLPGVQQCSCSLAENCIDMNHFCNCDADRSSWCDTYTYSLYDRSCLRSRYFI